MSKFKFTEVKKAPRVKGAITVTSLKRCEECKKVRRIQSNRSKCHGCRRLASRIKKGEVREPNYTEVNVANYKEPMVKVEKGFGYYGAITETNDGKQIQCHLCGYYYENLAAHITGRHETSVREYKIIHGLRIQDGLLSPEFRKAAQEKYNKYTRKTREEYQAMSRKGARVIKDRDIKRGGDMWRAITYNEKGLCKDQTIAKIRHVAEMCDGAPTSGAFAQEYGKSAFNAVNHWFGSWQKGVKAAGLETFLEQRRKEQKSRMKDTEGAMRTFYEAEGRTPQSSDFNTVEYLPSQRVVTRMFGSLNEARVAAGVPTLTYHKGKWIEQQPGEDTKGFVPAFLSRRRP